ncbi:MAG TPA: hypothetical protein P5277_00790 [Candidatus Paceibacterota bacterium]|nr:hypothetical protein [Candidatus Paceibacterota bacterium]
MKKDRRISIIFIILFSLITLLILIIANFGILGNVINLSFNKCGRIDNFKCVNDTSVNLCLSMFAYGNVNEASTEGCVTFWKESNPGKEKNIDKLKKCAMDYRERSISIYEFQSCLNYWNVYLENIASSYVAKPIIMKEIGIFTDTGRYFVYQWNYDKWVEITDETMKGDYLDEKTSRWFNEYTNESGLLPRSITPIVSYYYPSTDGGRIHLWAKVNDKMKFFIYNPSSLLSVKGWYDRTNLLSGTDYNSILKQWCDTSKCGVLPKNFEILTGYHFYDTNNVGRVNLFGLIDNQVHLLVYNPNVNLWYDRTEDIFSEGSEKFSADFIPKVGFYSELTGKEVYLFGKTNPDKYGITTKLYVYNISNGSWSERSIFNLMLPDKYPQAGYYDFALNKNVLWYNGNLVYTSADGKYSVSKDYLEGSGRLPPNEFYLTCKNSQLTTEQQEYLNLFNSEFELSDEIKLFIVEKYPWMNVKSLTNCDKVFMIKDFSDAISVLGASFS